MLTISDFTITFNKSRYYVRLALLLHLFAGIVVLNSSLPIVIVILMLLVLANALMRILRGVSHLPLYSKLTYHSKYWLLHGRYGENIQYDQMRICFDGGFFMLLHLSSDTMQKKIVLFKDQLNLTQIRMLHVIAKIGSKKQS